MTSERAESKEAVRKHAAKKHVKKVKDEMEYATNWQRVFINIYQSLKWLNAYAIINRIAMAKIIKKFMKNTFVTQDNVINNKLAKFIDEKKCFCNKDEIAFLIEEISEFFSEQFTNGNAKETAKILEHRNNKIRRHDAY